MIRHPPTSTLFPSTTLSRSPPVAPPADHLAPLEPVAEHPQRLADGEPVGRGREAVEAGRRGAGEDGLAQADDQLLGRSEEHTSELQSRLHLVCRLLLAKKKR